MSEPEVEDFAAMFEASVKTRRFSRGQAIEGTIVAIGPDTSLVNVGGKGEAVIETADLKDHENDLEFAVGDRLQAIVVGTTGGITLSRKGIRGAASLVQLDRAYQAGLPVEGKVEREVKGGYEVRVAGQRGFCPFSQIDTVRTADPAQQRVMMIMPVMFTVMFVNFPSGLVLYWLSNNILSIAQQAFSNRSSK